MENQQLQIATQILAVMTASEDYQNRVRAIESSSFTGELRTDPGMQKKLQYLANRNAYIALEQARALVRISGGS